MLLRIRVPEDVDRGPAHMEDVFATVAGGSGRNGVLTLSIVRSGRSVALYCFGEERFVTEFGLQLRSHYPHVECERLADDALAPPPTAVTVVGDIWLMPDLFPQRCHTDFSDPTNGAFIDPIGPLIAALDGAPEDCRPRIDFVMRPCTSTLRARAAYVIARIARPDLRANGDRAAWYIRMALSSITLFRLWSLVVVGPATFARRLKEGIDPRGDADLAAARSKLDRHLFEVHITIAVSAPERRVDAAKHVVRALFAPFIQYATTLTSYRLWSVRPIRKKKRPWARGSLLSAAELATLWHPPTAQVRAPALVPPPARHLEPPPNLPALDGRDGTVVLGAVRTRLGTVPVPLLSDDRRRHIAVLGKTGMGKSTLLLHLLQADILSGGGVALLDPHGDLADALLATIPSARTNDVIVMDAGDSEHPVGFNPLDHDHTSQRPLVASGIVSAFRKLYGDSWGPRLEHILRNAILTLLEVPGSTLVSVLPLLSSATFRRDALRHVSDPVIRAFWNAEFAGMPPKLQAEAIAPIQNKVGHFVASPLLRAIVGQKSSKLQLRKIMDGGKVLIVNLSKGRIGDDASALLGSLLVTTLQLSAMARADVPEAERRDFRLYVDEFQNFATESFASILSEARKYRVSLTVANQYLSQMDERTSAAVFGNVGTMLAFQVGADDAETLASQFGGEVTPQDLMNLPKYHAYARLLVDGSPARPFSLETLPPEIPADPRRAEIIRRTSRHRYARPVAEVERDVQAVFSKA